MKTKDPTFPQRTKALLRRAGTSWAL